MIYELRQYIIERGRMNDNHDRMANYNLDLFRKHGVNAVARWAAVAGPRMPMFCYLMQWKNFEEREAASQLPFRGADPIGRAPRHQPSREERQRSEWARERKSGEYHGRTL